MVLLTAEQHRDILQRLLDLARQRSSTVPTHTAGFEYSSLMACLLLHNMSVADVLLRMFDSLGKTWFPVTIGYTIARTMFEADVTAHYITKDRAIRASQYIDFGTVLNKRQMEACREHRNSKDPGWREAMSFFWKEHWAKRERDLINKFTSVAPQFTRTDKKGKKTLFQNWSGKSLRQMAVEVDHVEAYDIFYAELSSFTHVDVHLADRFLQHRQNGFVWSQRANEFDVGKVFRHAVSFLMCYMTLFATEFKQWTETEVEDCWQATAKNGITEVKVPEDTACKLADPQH
jgi:hypothetical protein